MMTLSFSINFTILYGIGRFIIVFNRGATGHYPEPDESSPYLDDPSSYYPPIMVF
jgi:hypothetical protein